MTVQEQPRLRMFAGPNGSGKSTMKALLRPELLGLYVNPDEIEAEVRRHDFFDLAALGIDTNESEILQFFQSSTLLAKAHLLEEAAALRFNDGKLSFFAVEVNSYYASVAADFVRQKLLMARRSFTFETVMSSVEFLRRAQRMGFRTYLYFVATDDSQINVSRVANRVRVGGHNVPTDKIHSRYIRSLELLSGALEVSNRAYLFDNSGAQLEWLAELENGRLLDLKTQMLPGWFQVHVLQKLTPRN